MTEAIHSDRNSGSPNGAQGETDGFAAIGAITGMLIISAMLLSGGSAPPGHLAAGPFDFAQGRLARRPSLHRSNPRNYDGKWKCTSCLEATGVPSSVAG